MQEITTIGLDLAKSVFQVHAVGTDGKVVLHAECVELQSRPRSVGLDCVLSEQGIYP